MLNFARVLAILAGLGGLPAIACNTVWTGVAKSGLSEETRKFGQPTDTGKTASGMVSFFLYSSIIASIGAIAIGAKARVWGKRSCAVLCLVFAAMFAAPIVLLNFFGLGPAGLLCLSAILILVAPAEQFRGVIKVELAV